MDHFIEIYTKQAAEYDRLLAAEDIDGNLPTALEEITSFHGKRILDLGTGTGRIPRLIHNRARQVVGLDLHMAMLRQNSAQRIIAGGQWVLLQGDMRLLPIASKWAQITLAGWAIGHLRFWFASNWKSQIGSILREMARVTARGGYMVIIETLGTGSLKPAPPAPELGSYYDWLENRWQFTRNEISTDYQFDSVDHAIATTNFFFGEELADLIRKHQWRRVPEWTGIWWKRV